MARALSSGVPEDMTKCGVNIVSPNYVSSDIVKGFVWSWDLGEPTSPSGCAVMRSSGRWATTSCQSSYRAACQSKTSPEVWQLSATVGTFEAAGKSCAEGFTFSRPSNGYHNMKLWDAALTEMIWLNVSVSDHYLESHPATRY